ncbi:cysteine hydrolase [Tardiphaga sp.]|uniref:cysteine hydrolase family protein n=1 Tax=Tardiphaga sp. TaxID=1926292 RepID=UPI00262D9A92|nr:cysteine hydrolase [Tardiphaga sp.]MDB5621156.1 Cysteine hydrolase [Tardiphaga sp.]
MGVLRSNIDSNRAVHLCLDMQRLFGPEGPWPTPWLERVMPAVISVVEHDPARTVFTRFIPPASPEEANGMWRSYFRKWRLVTRETLDTRILDLMPPLQRYVPPAVVFDKAVYSAFSNFRLHNFLQNSGVDTLIVTGAETDVCVLSTILRAVDLGYRIIVAQDGLCSSADQSHDALLGLYARRFDLQIELANCAEILEKWSPT